MKVTAYLLSAGAAAAAYLNIERQPSNSTECTLRIPDVLPSSLDSGQLFPTAPPLQKPRHSNVTFNATGPRLNLSGAARKHTWATGQQAAQVILLAVYTYII